MLEELRNVHSITSQIYNLCETQLANGGSDSHNSMTSKQFEYLNSNVERISSKLSVLEAQNKIRTLQWAISHSEVGQFLYQEAPGCTPRQSGELVRKILYQFMLGRACIISNDCLLARDSYGAGEPVSDDQLKAAFRAALESHLHILTGMKPTTKVTGGELYICYGAACC